MLPIHILNSQNNLPCLVHSLTSFLDHLARLETEAFGIWLQHCKNVEEKVLDLGKTEMNDNIDTVDGAKVYMQAEEVCVFMLF